MASTIGKIDLSTKDVMQHMTLRVRMPRSFTTRTRIACWLIGMAGRVMDVPCEIEMREDSASVDDGRECRRAGAGTYQPIPSAPTSPPPRKPIG